MQFVDLYRSANLEEVDACIALADFLAAATSLTVFYINKHTGRKISIDVKCATGDNLGTVTIKDT